MKNINLIITALSLKKKTNHPILALIGEPGPKKSKEDILKDKIHKDINNIIADFSNNRKKIPKKSKSIFGRRYFL